MRIQEGKHDTDDNIAAAVEIHRRQFWLSGVIRWQQAATAQTPPNSFSMHSPQPMLFSFQEMAPINRIHRQPHRMRFIENVSEISLFTNIHAL